MNRFLSSYRLRATGAAALAAAVLLFAAPTLSSAATYSLSFTGTVTGTFPESGGDVFAASGIVVGDAVSGTLTFDPLSESPNLMFPGQNHFVEPSATYTFRVTHPGAADLSFTETSFGVVDTIGAAAGKKIVLEGESTQKDLQVSFQTSVPPLQPPLASLAGLPDTPTGIMALLAGSPVSARGIFRLIDFGAVTFDIAFTPATTPIPATLPLFMSALGGLGFVGWRRRAARA